jgi:hypothetical protein
MQVVHHHPPVWRAIGLDDGALLEEVFPADLVDLLEVVSLRDVE